ncbi:MAG: asparagine synthase (glutamine-hydrolyzing) [bacterium]
MCGIVGGFSNVVGDSLVERMVTSLKHRGPDKQNFIFIRSNYDKKIFFGHTRLSIIDLSSAGDQPMFAEHENKKAHIVFNGEIYNYESIREELIQKGHSFNNKTDTEVVLNSYLEWGVNCVDKFVGMFAFAIWDYNKNKLLLFRDRFGVKPLYYFSDSSSFIFASELKAIYLLPNYRKELNYEALGYYFQYGYIPAPHTIFNNTYKLKPGSRLEVDLDGNHLETLYWSVESELLVEKKDYDNEESLVNEMEAILSKCFKRRMVADVKVGVLLSGGVDSSLVAALIQKGSNKKIKTFSIGFREKEYNEAHYAKRVANLLGTEHSEYYVSANDVKGIINDYVEIFDEPFGDSSALVTYLLAKNVRKDVKVALSGDGGDEMFLGYSKYSAIDKIHNKAGFLRLSFSKILQVLNPSIVSSVHGSISKYFPIPQYSNLREKIYKLTNALNANNIDELISTVSSHCTLNEAKKILGKENIVSLTNGNFHYKQKMQLWDFLYYLPDDILVKSDRTSMAVGLEAREPFLDVAIWKFVNSVPDKIRYKDIGSKYLLKKVLAKYLPTDLVYRPKCGFRPPMYEWMKNEWSPLLRENLDDDFLKKQEIFNVSYIDDIKKRWNKGSYVNPDKLWLLLSFQLWYKRWFVQNQ